MATGAAWLRRLRIHLDDLPGDVQASADYDAQTCYWSPEDLVGYWNAAREELCLRAPILDATGPVTSVTVDGGGDGRVTLDPAVLVVERVAIAGVALRRETVETLDWVYPPTLGDTDPWELRTGEPECYLIEDGRPMTLRLWPAPTEDTALRLRVRRAPAVPLTVATLEAEIDEPVSESDGQALIWWAASLAYQRPDSSTYSEALAAQNAARFEAQVGPRPGPSLLALRQRLAGQPPQRTRVYS